MIKTLEKATNTHLTLTLTQATKFPNPKFPNPDTEQGSEIQRQDQDLERFPQK